MKLIKSDKNIYTVGHNKYSKVEFQGVESLETIIEITEESYKKYINSKGYGEDVIYLMSKNGRKILLFHNSPKGISTRSKNYINDIYRADILICCYSLFLYEELRKKAIIKTPLKVHTKIFESGGKKFLKIESQLKGYLPQEIFQYNEKEISLDILIKRIG